MFDMASNTNQEIDDDYAEQCGSKEHDWGLSGDGGSFQAGGNQCEPRLSREPLVHCKSRHCTGSALERDSTCSRVETVRSRCRSSSIRPPALRLEHYSRLFH